MNHLIINKRRKIKPGEEAACPNMCNNGGFMTFKVLNFKQADGIIQKTSAWHCFSCNAVCPEASNKIIGFYKPIPKEGVKA